MPYLGSLKQLDNTEVIDTPSPLRRASADAFDLAATLASFAFCAALAASVVAAAVSA
jgi:hypothetical protein